MRRRFVLAIPVAAALTSVHAAEAPVRVVAAQAHYADLVRQVAGENAAVEAVPIGPNQDPHGFEPGLSVGRAVAQAGLVVLNGLGYDPWMGRLLGAAPVPVRLVVNAAEVLRRRAGDNPHVWFDPAGIAPMIEAIVQALSLLRPASRPGLLAGATVVREDMRPLLDRVAALKGRVTGLPVTATEPVFNPMLEAVGLSVRHERFQRAIMNETEPRASDVAAMEADLRGRRVRALIHNTQTTGGSADRLLELARRAGVPIVPVTETMPAGLRYQDWLLGLLGGLERALLA